MAHRLSQDFIEMKMNISIVAETSVIERQGAIEQSEAKNILLVKRFAIGDERFCTNRVTKDEVPCDESMILNKSDESSPSAMTGSCTIA